jgi:hypothetical protein
MWLFVVHIVADVWKSPWTAAVRLRVKDMGWCGHVLLNSRQEGCF